MTLSTATCPTCNADSQVEDSRRVDTWYVKRVRACTVCGLRWRTAEIPLPMMKRVIKFDAFLKQMGEMK